jgi:3-hydroxybutyryl-CoA dehydratase
MSEPAYFEDFHVGDRVHTPARTITETDVVVFQGLAGDAGGSVVRGLHTLSIGVGLMFLAGDRGIPRSTIALWGLDHVRFAAPAEVGDTVHVEAEVTQTTRVDGHRGLIAMTHHMKNQRGEEILTCSVKLVTGRRPAAAESGHG